MIFSSAEISSLDVSPKKLPSAAAWRPRRREPQFPPPPDSPSVSTHVSIGYESESRDSSPDDSEVGSSRSSTTLSRGLVAEQDDATFRDYVLEGILLKKLHLQLHGDSCGGTYMVNCVKTKKPIAVFKPADEEIGQDANPHGNRDSERVDQFVPGTGYKREILAYALDYDRSAGVPQTVEICIHGKLGSLQRFMPNCTESADHLPGRFSTDLVHRIALLDLRLLNGDRHGGNILVSSVAKAQHPLATSEAPMLVPIDHSYVAPSGFADPELEWLYWPQAKLPFSDKIRAYVAALDPEVDRGVVDDILNDEEAAEIVCATTTAIKIAVSRGYTARDIAEWFRRETLTQPSRLEHALAVCRRTLDDGGDIDMEQFGEQAGAAFPVR